MGLLLVICLACAVVGFILHRKNKAKTEKQNAADVVAAARKKE